MISLKIFHVNAFSNEDFKGNPAGVVPLEFWLSDDLMQKIAKQNSLSETAFFVETSRGFKVRWFTPEIEIDLCGHATLASAYVLFELIGYAESKILFESKSGDLIVTRKEGKYFLDFPAYESVKATLDFPFEKVLGVKPVGVYQANDDLLVEVGSIEDLVKIKPDFKLLSKLDCRGVIVTCQGGAGDFSCRFFAPKLGINEDSVTGSAFSKLLPFWANRLGKNTFFAEQLSERTGKVYGEYLGDRVVIGGDALHFLSGEIFIKG